MRILRERPAEKEREVKYEAREAAERPSGGAQREAGGRGGEEGGGSEQQSGWREVEEDEGKGIPKNAPYYYTVCARSLSLRISVCELPTPAPVFTDSAFCWY